MTSGIEPRKRVFEQKKCISLIYDALNRITSGISNDGKFDLSSVSYDKMGNIMSLQRKGGIVANIDYTKSEHFGMMDNLDYEYDGANKLTKVTELPGGNITFGFKDGSNTNDDFEYDNNGNLIIDRNKGISSITYNHLNLPVTVAISNAEGTGNISYIYDATGAKLKKTAPSGGSLIETEYAGKYIYKNGNLEFFNHPEGIVEKEADGYKYVYQFKDHLDNVRLSYKDANKDGSITQDEIVQEKNYYPFGLTHKGYNSVLRGRNHTYGFTNKEEQDEIGLGWIDITARNYDPALGRWMNLDPLAEQMRRHSPYNYGFDNPIYFIDYDGMMPTGSCCGGLKGLARAVKKTWTESWARSVNQVKSFFAKGDNSSLVGNEKQTAKGGIQPFVSKEFQKDGIATPNIPEPGADITSGDGDGIAVLAESQPGPDLGLDKTTDIVVGAAQLVDQTVSTVDALSGGNSNEGSISTTNTTDNVNETTTISVTNVLRVDVNVRNGDTIANAVTATKDTVVNTQDASKIPAQKDSIYNAKLEEAKRNYGQQ